MTKKNEVAQADQNTDLAMFGTDRPDYIGDSGRGSEQVSTNDMTLPRLSIIQDLSPQRKKTNAEYIEGAEEGMVFNTATNELYTKPLVLVPCYFRSEYVAWKDRKSGGGFGGAFPTEQEAQEWISQQQSPELWDVNYTHQHFCVMVMPGHTADAPKLRDVVLSMSRSQLKPSRKLNTTIQQAGGDRFARAFVASVVQDRSEKGEFYNWDFKALGFVPKEVFDRAETVYEAVKSGARDVSRDDLDRGAAVREDQNDM